MDNRRFLLIALLGVVLFFLYQAWQKDYARPAAALAAAASSEEIPAAQTGEVPSAVQAPGAEDTPAPAAPLSAPASAGERLVVVTDRLRAEIALDGGDLRRLDLLGYPVSKQQPDQPLTLLDDRGASYFVLQSGLGGAREPVVSHLSRYTAASRELRLAPGENEVVASLEARGPAGETVIKRYRFRRDSYQVALEHEVLNSAAEPLLFSPYTRLVRRPSAAADSVPFVPTFLGVGFYEQKDGGEGYRFRKIALADLPEETLDRSQPGGWLAVMQHYFIAAILPPGGEPQRYSAKPARDGNLQSQVLGPAVTVAPGARATVATELYLGPKLQTRIDAVAPGLELTVDYGILTPISEPLFWVLNWLYEQVGNWGWAIVLLTLLVKALFYKLSEAQYRSMAKMKHFAPRIQEIKDRYGDDRERLSKAMMDLYKKEGFNPLAGCWPLLVQMPVFFALYWVFLESVELRQADWLLWINDLTAPDPYYVLPVLYGLSMWAMQKLSGQNATLDPMQQRIMNIMPIALTAFFAFFPSGLVLYWLVSNLVSIAQQAYITRKIEREGFGQKKPA
ncbi:MAG TPA: membrane protein insertase YidC [Nevskiaceae bacterium]|nr:membrane protein insertase YidC [Nevskiaceae bacterium]